MVQKTQRLWNLQKLWQFNRSQKTSPRFLISSSSSSRQTCWAAGSPVTGSRTGDSALRVILIIQEQDHQLYIFINLNLAFALSKTSNPLVNIWLKEDVKNIRSDLFLICWLSLSYWACGKRWPNNSIRTIRALNIKNIKYIKQSLAHMSRCQICTIKSTRGYIFCVSSYLLSECKIAADWGLVKC